MGEEEPEDIAVRRFMKSVMQTRLIEQVGCYLWKHQVQHNFDITPNYAVCMALGLFSICWNFVVSTLSLSPVLQLRARRYTETRVERDKRRLRERIERNK